MTTHQMVTLLTRSTVLEVLRRLHDAVQCKQSVSWKRGDRKLHHDNATAHSSQLVQNFLVKHQIPQVLQSPCSPCDFFYSQRRNMLLGKNRFQDTEEIKRDKATLGCLLTWVSYLCPMYRHGHCLLIVPDENSCVPSQKF